MAFLPEGKKRRFSYKLLRVVADMSPLVCVIVGWCWAWCYRHFGVDEVREVGLDSASLTFSWPNEGTDIRWDLFLRSAGIMAVVSFLETVNVGGKFAGAARYSVRLKPGAHCVRSQRKGTSAVGMNALLLDCVSEFIVWMCRPSLPSSTHSLALHTCIPFASTP